MSQKEDKEKLENCYRRRGTVMVLQKAERKRDAFFEAPRKRDGTEERKNELHITGKIDGTLNLAEGTVSELTVWLHDRPEMTVTVTGDMVQTAKINPLRQNGSKSRYGKPEILRLYLKRCISMCLEICFCRCRV